MRGERDVSVLCSRRSKFTVLKRCIFEYYVYKKISNFIRKNVYKILPYDKMCILKAFSSRPIRINIIGFEPLNNSFKLTISWNNGRLGSIILREMTRPD